MSRRDATVVIRASAGTGKTYQLTNRYLGLIKDGVKPEHILAVTFTRLAAGEILERVMLRLSKAAVDVDECNQLARDLDDRAFSRERCLNLLEELTGSLHRVRVETLDAYFAQLARSFSLEIGLPPNWEIMEEVRDRRLRWEALQQTIVDDSDRTVSRLIRILFQGEARRNVCWQIYSAVNDFYSVLQETDEDAWRKFPVLKPLASEPLISAIQQLEAVELPNDKRIRAQHDKNIAAARSHDWAEFVGRGVAGQILKGLTTYYGKEMSSDLVSVYNQLIDHSRAVLINQLRHQTEATFEILRRFDRHYHALKQRHRGIRFDDVTQHLMKLGNSANPDEQGFRMDTDISHLLLDEFQDTSLRQWQIIRPLAERITSVRKTLFESAWSSFFCVGDVKQAIYGWRGGRSEIFDALEKHLDGIHERSLTRSYRSAPVIIDTVNQVFKGIRNHDRLEAVEEIVYHWSDSFPEHQTALTEAGGFVQLETAPLPDNGEERVLPTVQQDTTFEFTARKIKELNELAPDRTIGVLVRKNDTVARLIYELRKLGVKASEERGGNPLTDSAAVQVILSVLRLSDHPDDNIAAYHIATSPIGEELGIDSGLDPKACFELSRETRRRLMELGYCAAVARWAKQLEPFSNPRDRRRLQQLVELAYRFEPIAGIRATEFLNFVESERIADPLISNVRVMTIHQSKGLEFDTVVLPELEGEIDDYSRSVVWDSPDPTESIDRVCIYRKQEIQAVLPEDMQQMFTSAKNREAVESLCLLYVALTRAAHALYMIIAPATKGTRSRPRTFAGLLHVALAPEEKLEGETVLFQTGDELWFESEKLEVAKKGETIELPKSISIGPSSSATRFEFKSPSSLEGGTRVSATALLQPSNRKALDRGTVIHGLFEQVNWIEDVPSDRDLLEVANKLCDGHVDPEKQVSDFRRMLEKESIAKVLNQDYYLEPFDESVIEAIPDSFNLGKARFEVHNERSFVVPESTFMLSGTIDRLVLIFNGDQLLAADVVDYKTDKIDFDDAIEVKNRTDHYRPQIEAYRRAVSSLFGLEIERISARLVFVSGDQVAPFSPISSPSPV